MERSNGMKSFRIGTMCQLIEIICKAKSAGVTMSEFARKILDKGNVIERLTVEQADFIRKLCGMANNLNQLTHRANAEGFHVIAPFHKTIIGKIDEILNLIRR